ncbi:hypothetical protein [Streptomyces sp. NPDC055036]
MSDAESATDGEAAAVPEARPVSLWEASITPPACVAVDRSWWIGSYGQWSTATVGRGKGVPRAVVRFARTAEAEGWAVALRAGSRYSEDGETSVGVWEVEATGRCHDNADGGQADTVLSVMWVQRTGGGRWAFDAELSGAEIGGRVLPGIVQLADYEKAARVGRPVQPDATALTCENV